MDHSVETSKLFINQISTITSNFFDIVTEKLINMAEERNEDEIIATQPLATNSVHRTYLVTYSQINAARFPTRVSFGSAVVQAFGAQNVEYYAVGKEPHEQTNGYHYHVAIKLNKTMRWHAAREYLHETFGVNCNFATTGQMYAGAYRYTTKSDNLAEKFNVTKKHPNLDMITAQWQQAMAANNTFRENANQRRIAAAASQEPAQKKKKGNERCKKSDVAKFCVQNRIKSETKLMAVCVERRDAGDSFLYDSLISMSRKVRSELVEDAWRFEEAGNQLMNENCDRLSVLMDTRNNPCNCNGLWMTLAKDILDKNGFEHVHFANVLKNSIVKGREKEANVFVYGPGDSGKSFILKPILKILPLVFSNPANSQFAWKGAENSNLIFLNDLRWAPLDKKDGFIAWSKFLNLLEGFEEQLPAPMNQNSSMVTISKKMPIWATSNGPILYWENHRSEPVTPHHSRENDVMKWRWNSFEFKHQYRGDEKVECEDCCSCFAKFILDYSDI